METHAVKILNIQNVTHNVKRFTVEKPSGYTFLPGQATEIAINQPAWVNEKRPFTFTSLNDWPHLEFTIKIYGDHDGVTHQLGKLIVGDELILHDIFGAINYQGEGVFLAGGAGVTPFIAILRQLHKDGKLSGNKLIFSNKTPADIILKDEFSKLLGDNFINTLTQESVEPYEDKKIDREYLKEKIHDFSQYFYICGPDEMVFDLRDTLYTLGADKDRVVTEEF